MRNARRWLFAPIVLVVIGSAVLLSSGAEDRDFLTRIGPQAEKQFGQRGSWQEDYVFSGDKYETVIAALKGRFDEPRHDDPFYRGFRSKDKRWTVSLISSPDRAQMMGWPAGYFEVWAYHDQTWAERQLDALRGLAGVNRRRPSPLFSPSLHTKGFP